MSACKETYRPYYDRHAEPVPCFREINGDGRHRGKHQGWTETARLVTWDAAGAVTRRATEDYATGWAGHMRVGHLTLPHGCEGAAS